MPPFTQVVFDRFGRVIGVRSCIRPLNATFFMAAGRYGDARIRCRSKRRAASSLRSNAFPDPDRADHLSLPLIDLLTPDFPVSSSLVFLDLRLRKSQGSDNLPAVSSSPRCLSPSCWPKRSLQASAAFASTFSPASCLLPPLFGAPIEQRPSRL